MSVLLRCIVISSSLLLVSAKSPVSTQLYVRASVEIRWLKHVFLDQHGWTARHRRWQHPPFWETEQLDTLTFPWYDAQRRVDQLYKAFPLLQQRHKWWQPRLADKLFDYLWRDAEGLTVGSFLAVVGSKAATHHFYGESVSLPHDQVEGHKGRRDKRLYITADQKLSIANLLFFARYHLPLVAKELAEQLEPSEIRGLEALIEKHYESQQRAIIKKMRSSQPQEERSHFPYLQRINFEQLLQLSHAPAMVWAIIKRKPLLALTAGTVGAGAFALRTIRLQQEYMHRVADGEWENEREEIAAQHNVALSALLVPSMLVGGKMVSRLLGRAKRASWRAWRGQSWRSRIANLDFIAHFGISRTIDAKSHLERKENPLTSHNYGINTGYNVIGAFMNRYALMRSQTWGGRLTGMVALSAVYSIGNVYVQELQKLMGSEFDADNLRFDNMWGVFHSSPRNLLDWSLWNMLVSRITGPGVASCLAPLITGIRLADGVQRKIWYSQSKLSYLYDNYSFWEAQLDMRVKDYWPWHD